MEWINWRKICFLYSCCCCCGCCWLLCAIEMVHSCVRYESHTIGLTLEWIYEYHYLLFYQLHTSHESRLSVYACGWCACARWDHSRCSSTQWDKETNQNRPTERMFSDHCHEHISRFIPTANGSLRLLCHLCIPMRQAKQMCEVFKWLRARIDWMWMYGPSATVESRMQAAREDRLMFQKARIIINYYLIQFSPLARLHNWFSLRKKERRTGNLWTCSRIFKCQEHIHDKTDHKAHSVPDLGIFSLRLEGLFLFGISEWGVYERLPSPLANRSDKGCPNFCWCHPAGWHLLASVSAFAI